MTKKKKPSGGKGKGRVDPSGKMLVAKHFRLRLPQAVWDRLEGDKLRSQSHILRDALEKYLL